MKRVLKVLLIVTAVAISAIASAKESSIVESLANPQKGGEVKVYQSPAMSALLQRDTVALSDRLVPGYRIQVFSDNSQKKAKELAQERARTIEESDKTLTAYVTFNSPFWRVRVGNFTSYEEAAIKLRELKKMYPEYHDMRIVKDNIVEKY